MRLSLFPLNVVMFPGMVMPLHIFEDRYKLMVRRCLREGKPFGIVLIQQGSEVGGEATPHPVGTMAYITDVEPLAEGRMNITATGSGRFRIQEIVNDQPYLEAEVEAFPLLAANEAEVKPLIEYLQPRIASYLEMLNQDEKVKFATSDMPDDPVDLAYLIAIALQLPLDDKQALLQTRSAADLLAIERRVLAREQLLLRFMLQTADAQRQLIAGPTGHLFLN